MRESLTDYCARTQRQTLLDQWDQVGNAPLTPAGLSYGSRQKVWWICEKGHRGKRRCTPEPGRRAAAPTAPANGPGQGSMIWLPSSLTWPRSGTPRGTGTSPRTNPVGQRLPGVVAVCPGARVERPGEVPDGRGRLSLLRQPADSNRGQRLGRPIPRPGPGMAPHEERDPHPPGRGGRQPAEGLVAVPPKATCGRRPLSPGPREGPAARCAPGNRWPPGRMTWPPSSLPCRAVGPGAKRGPHSPAGLPLQQPHGLVAVRAGAQLAGCRQWPGPRAATAPTAPAARSCRGSTTWPPGTPWWRRNGTRPSTAASTPQMVTAGSHKKVWWRCPENHVWKAVIYSRTGPKHCGCPVCAGKVSGRNQAQYHFLR